MPSLTVTQPLLTEHATLTIRTSLFARANILDSDLRLSESIGRVPVSRHEIDADRVRVRGHEEAQRHYHAKFGVVSRVRRCTQDRRHNRTTAHGADNETRSALGVLAQTAHAQGDDGGEANAFEEERDEEHGNAGVAGHADRRCDEDDAQAEVDQEDPSGPDEFHEERADEATERESALGAGEELGGRGV